MLGCVMSNEPFDDEGNENGLKHQTIQNTRPIYENYRIHFFFSRDGYVNLKGKIKEKCRFYNHSRSRL